MMVVVVVLFFFLWIVILVSPVVGDIVNGTCRVAAFVPLTNSNTRLADPSVAAFSYAAALQLAVDHFNQRNAQIVPELGQLDQTCPHIRIDSPLELIDIQGGNNGVAANAFFRNDLHRAYELGQRHAREEQQEQQQSCNNHQAQQQEPQQQQHTLQRTMAQISDYCALVGPSQDRASWQVSVMAQSIPIPLVLTGGLVSTLVHPVRSPFTSRTFPQSLALSEALAMYLQHTKRDNFVAILYPLTELGTELVESVNLMLDDFHIRSKRFPYNEATLDAFVTDPTDRRILRNTLARIVQSGYRTIVWLVDDFLVDVPRLMGAMNQTPGMLVRHRYVWITIGYDEQVFVVDQHGETLVNNYRRYVDRDSNIDPAQLLDFATRHIMEDTSVVRAVDGFLLHDSYQQQQQQQPLQTQQASVDPFAAAWKAQNETHVERVQQLYGYQDIPPDFFANSNPVAGTSFLFDAVVAVGIGACLANASSSSGTTTTTTTLIGSERHNEGIRNAEFHGASGFVRFRDQNNIIPGGRSTEGALFASYELRRTPDDTLEVRLTSVLNTSRMAPGERVPRWQRVYPGKPGPDVLLRDTPNQNYLSDAARLTGYVVAAVSWALLVFFSAWIAQYRQHRVLKAAQPPFLVVLHAGAALMIAVVIPLSFDENLGFDQRQLSNCCTSVPWLFSLGYVTTYMALFSKLYRINKVLQFRRAKVNVDQALWPIRILVGCTVVLLSVWTGLGGAEYRRVEIDDETGESIGNCTAENTFYWLLPFVSILGTATVMTGYIAWKTKDVASAFAESKWIMTAITTQMQVLIVSVPTLWLLNGQSTNARYIGVTLAVFTFSMSISGLVMVPKFFAFYNPNGVMDSTASLASGRQFRGTGHGIVHVSGIRTPADERYETSAYLDTYFEESVNDLQAQQRRRSEADFAQRRRSEADFSQRRRSEADFSQRRRSEADFSDHDPNSSRGLCT